MLFRDNLFTIGYVVVNLVLFLVIEIVGRDVGAGNAAGLYIKGYGAMLLFNIAFLFIFRFLRPAELRKNRMSVSVVTVILLLVLLSPFLYASA